MDYIYSIQDVSLKSRIRVSGPVRNLECVLCPNDRQQVTVIVIRELSHKFYTSLGGYGGDGHNIFSTEKIYV